MLKQKWEAGCRIHIKWLKDDPLPEGSGFFILSENKLNPYKKHKLWATGIFEMAPDLFL
ncbi:MAG: hypothetical protein O9353_10310 [Bacteroidia bacterium]|nr:hypothetical protein [Bacteroidia bacterium]